MNYQCPCCGYLTFDEEPSGSFDICPVCYWEDDDTQNNDPTYGDGANGISLNTAKENYSKFGAIKEKYIRKVRKPLPNEYTR